MQHRDVEAQRRRRVDDAEHRWLFVERGVVNLSRNTYHLEHVLVALAAEAVAVQSLVGVREHVVRAFEVADRGVQVDRFDGVARYEVNDVEYLRKFEQIAEVFARARVAAAFEVDKIWRAGYRSKGHIVAANIESVRGVA